MINITLTDTSNNKFYSYLKGWERALRVYEEEFGIRQNKQRPVVKIQAGK